LSTFVDLVDRLTLLQIDPTAAVAPNADLVAWRRLGAAYDPADLTRALEQDRTPRLRRGDEADFRICRMAICRSGRT
jgi:uncharacterized protein YcaQ